MLNHCLEKHDRFSEGHLLMAQVFCTECFVHISYNHTEFHKVSFSFPIFCPLERLYELFLICSQNFDLYFIQIHLKEGNYRMADQSLEVGLSYNFQVSFCFVILACFV